MSEFQRSGGIHVRPEDVHKLDSLLVDTYSRPTTPVREIIVNALEVQPEGIPVEVSVDSVSPATSLLCDDDVSGSVITVTDRGPGMDRDFMETYLCGLMASTKEDVDGAIGGFGIGSKSVMSISDFTTWRSTKDGVTTTLIMSKGDEGEVETHFESVETGEDNGTTVKINTDGNTIRLISDSICRDFLDYADPERVTYSENGIPVEVGRSGAYSLKPGEFIFMEDSRALIALSRGNVPYVVCGTAPIDMARGVVFRYDLSRKSVTPNREEIIRSDEVVSTIIKEFSRNYDKEKKRVEQRVKSAAGFPEWVSAMRSLSNFDMEAEDSLYFLGRSVMVFNTPENDGKKFADEKDRALEGIKFSEIRSPRLIFTDMYLPDTVGAALRRVMGQSYNGKMVGALDVPGVLADFDGFIRKPLDVLPDRLAPHYVESGDRTKVEYFAQLLGATLVDPDSVSREVKSRAKANYRTIPRESRKKVRKSNTILFSPENDYEGEYVSNISELLRSGVFNHEVLVIPKSRGQAIYKELGLTYLVGNPASISGVITRIGSPLKMDYGISPGSSWVSQKYPDMPFGTGSGRGSFYSRFTGNRFSAAISLRGTSISDEHLRESIYGDRETLEDFARVGEAVGHHTGRNTLGALYSSGIISGYEKRIIEECLAEKVETDLNGVISLSKRLSTMIYGESGS